MTRMLVGGGWRLVLVLAVMSKWCVPASGGEATGADPFAPGSPGKPDDKRKLEVSVQRSQIAILQRRAGTPNDETFLVDSLRLLHAATCPAKLQLFRGSVADLLRGLAERPWQRPAGEPWHAYFARLAERAEQAGGETNRRLAEWKQQYAELTKDPWPFDWQAQREVWLDLLELMVATKSGEDLKVRWRAAANKHASEADLFCKAYIVSLRVSPKPNLDWEFVQPVVVNHKAWRERLRWSVEALEVLLAAGVDSPGPERKEAADALLRTIREAGDNLYSLPDEDLRALGRLYRGADDRAQPEAAAILSATLNTEYGNAFHFFANAAGIPPERRRDVMLATPVRLSGEGTLEQSLHTILDSTKLRVWIDETVRDSKARLDTGVLAGSRMEVLEKLLARTDLLLERLEHNLFWIGSPDRLAAARQVHANSLQRAAGAQGKVATALADDTRLEFIETPPDDAIAFLRDAHDVEIQLLDQPQKRLTMNMKAIPLHLGLTHLARYIDGDWCVAGDTIFVGSKERLATVQQFELIRLHRWSRLALVDNALTRALGHDHNVAQNASTG
jgi:hypothetical protein